uniref:Pentatricopeptide repeat-containing protein n=1 Tax=Rhizophora mucronata TaxID=61149 RepID=A0A2P2P1Y2_RHIMU
MKNAKLPFIKPSISSSTCHHNSLIQSQNLIFQPNEGYQTGQTSSSLSSALQHYINSEAPFYGQKIHTHIVKTGFRPNINISIKLLILHLKCGCLKHGRQVFDELSLRTLSAYNYMIAGYLKQGLVEKSINLVRRLVNDGERPDGYTLSMILKASTGGSDVILPRNLEGTLRGSL